jgi:uncharacterized protein YdaU (DUF1376 family)
LGIDPLNAHDSAPVPVGRLPDPPPGSLGKGATQLKTLPYFRWYPADAVGDEFYAHLTCAELGVYHRCLDHSWMNDGIPADTAALAIICHMSRKPFEKVWGKVNQRWSASPRDPARLVNPRQERERDYAIRVGENNKRPGNANAFKSRTDGDKNAFHAGARRASDSVSDSDSEQPTQKKEPATREPDLFDAFWEIFVDGGKALNDEDKGAALKLWLDFSLDDQQKIIAWAKTQLYEKWTEERYMPMPAKVLRDKGWTRVAKVRKPSGIPPAPIPMPDWLKNKPMKPDCWLPDETEL